MYKLGAGRSEVRDAHVYDLARAVDVTEMSEALKLDVLEASVKFKMPANDHQLSKSLAVDLAYFLNVEVAHLMPEYDLS